MKIKNTSIRGLLCLICFIGYASFSANFSQASEPTSPTPFPVTPDTPLLKTTPPLKFQLPYLSKVQLMKDGANNLNPILRGKISVILAGSIVIYGRYPTKAEMNMRWWRVLNYGVNGFLKNEWYSKAAKNRVIALLYLKILGRLPTVTELSNGFTIFQSSGRLALIQSIYTSDSYSKLYPTTQAKVTSLAKNMLNILPGTISSQSIYNALQQQNIQTVVSDLFYSDLGLNNAIDDAYRLVLRRAATATELATQSERIRAGLVNIDGLIEELLFSTAFYRLAFNSGS